MGVSAQFAFGGTPQYKAVSCNANGDNELIAAVAGTVIRVIGFTIISTSAVNGTFYSGAAGTALTGAMPLANGLGGTERFSGHFETVAGQALVLNLSSGIATTGYLTYISYKP